MAAPLRRRGARDPGRRRRCRRLVSRPPAADPAARAHAAAVDARRALILLLACASCGRSSAPCRSPTGGNILDSNVPAVLAGSLARHRPGRQRRLLPPPVRRPGRRSRSRSRSRPSASCSAACSAPSPATSAAGWTRCSSRLLDVLIAFPALVLALAIAAGSRPERAAHDLGAVLLQRPGVRADLRAAHAARARAAVHDRRPAVRHRASGGCSPGTSRPTSCPRSSRSPARHRHRDHPRGRARLPRLGIPPPAAELGEHDRPGAERACRRARSTCSSRALVLLITVVAFNLLGDGLRERWGATGMTRGALLEVERAAGRIPAMAAGGSAPSTGSAIRVDRGRTLAVIGESGSGKTVSCRAIMGLLPPTATVSPARPGSRRRAGRAVRRQLRWHRGSGMAMVFQDPARSLNPTMRIGAQITEAIQTHAKAAQARAPTTRRIELLELVRMPAAERRFHEYPHQLSGGMRQRVMIAIALAASPKLLIADEATTALDVTTQAQIMELLLDLQQQLGMALIMISHDLGLAALRRRGRRDVRRTGGRAGADRRLFGPRPDALHPGAARRDPAPGARRALGARGRAGGQPPDLARCPPGCPFAPRCPSATSSAGSTRPRWRARARPPVGVLASLRGRRSDRIVG